LGVSANDALGFS